MTALSPRQMHTLDHACRPIAEAFGNAPFLVGTAGVRGSAYRDVDVRLILTDEEYRKLKRAVGKRAITLMGFAIGEWLANRTGMPIDFQIQQMTSANAQHDGMRNPLGVRHLGNWPGDGAPLSEQQQRQEQERQVAVDDVHRVAPAFLSALSTRSTDPHTSHTNGSQA